MPTSPGPVSRKRRIALDAVMAAWAREREQQRGVFKGMEVHEYVDGRDGPDGMWCTCAPGVHRGENKP